MNEEVWVAVPGYEGNYEVSSFGRVKSLAKNIPSIRPEGVRIRKTREIILKPSVMPMGYCSVILYRDKNPKKFLIHRMVLLAFVGESNMEVNHINGDKGDNSIGNLEYCSHSENMQHRSKVLMKCIGESCSAAKLTEDDVANIRNDGRVASAIAKQYGVTPQAIRNIRRRRTWKHVW